MRLTQLFPAAGRSRTAAASTGALVALASAGLLLLPSASQAQSRVQASPSTVLLGTSGIFAVLAGSGITNTGVTTLVGDSGSSPVSSQSGFSPCPAADCVTQTGVNHTAPNPNDATTQDAKADLRTAYVNAAGRTPTEVPTELASEQPLVAGVYNSASGTFGMTGTLILDGENNPDAVWIFQTASTLITGSTAKVSLVRGAQACNVFWKVGSAATLGAGSTFRGTILAHDDISLGNDVTVEGRLLAGAQPSGAGAVTLIHDTIVRPTCTTPATTPVVTPTEPVVTPTEPVVTPTEPVVTPTEPVETPTDLAAGTPTETTTGTPTGTTTGTTSQRSTTPGLTRPPGDSTTRTPGDSTTRQLTRVPAGAVPAGDGSAASAGGSAGTPVLLGAAAGLGLLALLLFPATRARGRHGRS